MEETDAVPPAPKADVIDKTTLIELRVVGDGDGVHPREALSPPLLEVAVPEAHAEGLFLGLSILEDEGLEEWLGESFGVVDSPGETDTLWEKRGDPLILFGVALPSAEGERGGVAREERDNRAREIVGSNEGVETALNDAGRDKTCEGET